MRPRTKAGGKTHCAFYQQQCSKESSFSHVAGRVPWCSLAYWEERRRVGRLSPVFSPGVEVFAVQPKPPPIGDALSLAQLAQGANHRPSEATLRTREKIGLGNTSFWMMQNHRETTTRLSYLQRLFGNIQTYGLFFTVISVALS